MFDKETYIRRRAELKRLVGSGIILLPGNNESPANYPANAYSPMRQDSTSSHLNRYFSWNISRKSPPSILP